MRRILLVLVAVVAAAALWSHVPATAAEHAGCKGVENALTRGKGNGKAAVQAVADKLGCGADVPADPFACPSGQTSLAVWSYAGALSTDTDEYGYHYWIGDPGWTATSGTGAAVTDGDAGGFYFSEAVADSVKTIVGQSMTGEIVQIIDSPAADPTFVLDPSRAISHNWFVERTGFKTVRFCG